MEQHLIYHGPITQRGVNNVETLLVASMREGAERIVLHICSAGGDVTSGIGLYNFIRALPVRVDTHAFGVCGSIAATIFLAGEARTTVTTNAFSLHAATYIEGPLKGQVANNTNVIALPFKERLGWKPDRITHYFGDAADKQILPDQAVQMRIATAIQDLRLPSNPERITNVSIPAP